MSLEKNLEFCYLDFLSKTNLVVNDKSLTPKDKLKNITNLCRACDRETHNIWFNYDTAYTKFEISK